MSMIHASVDELDALVADGLRRGVVEGVDGCVSGARSIIPKSELFKSCAAWVNSFCFRFDQCCATGCFCSNAEFGRYIQSTYTWFRDDYVYLDKVSIAAYNHGLAYHGFYVAPTETGIFIFMKDIGMFDGRRQISQFLFDAMSKLLNIKISTIYLLNTTYQTDNKSYAFFKCEIKRTVFVTNDTLNDHYHKLFREHWSTGKNMKYVGMHTRDMFGRRDQVYVPSSFLLQNDLVEVIALCIDTAELAIAAILCDPAKSATREIGAAGDRGLLKALVYCGFASMFSVLCSITQKCVYNESVEACLVKNMFPKDYFCDLIQYVNCGFMSSTLGDLNINLFELSNNNLIVHAIGDAESDHNLVMTEEGFVDYYTRGALEAMRMALPPTTTLAQKRNDYIKFI